MLVSVAAPHLLPAQGALVGDLAPVRLPPPTFGRPGGAHRLASRLRPSVQRLAQGRHASHHRHQERQQGHRIRAPGPQGAHRGGAGAVVQAGRVLQPRHLEHPRVRQEAAHPGRHPLHRRSAGAVRPHRPRRAARRPARPAPCARRARPLLARRLPDAVLDPAATASAWPPLATSGRSPSTAWPRPRLPTAATKAPSGSPTSTGGARPHVASFKSGSFDFVIVSTHIRWGDDEAGRARTRRPGPVGGREAGPSSAKTSAPSTTRTSS